MIEPNIERCTAWKYVPGLYDDAMYRCELCNHLYNHQLETSKGGTYSHGCGEWVEIWPSKFAKCVLTVLHDGPCLGEVVTNHIPRKDYAAYVDRNAAA